GFRVSGFWFLVSGFGFWGSFGVLSSSGFRVYKEEEVSSWLRVYQSRRESGARQGSVVPRIAPGTAGTCYMVSGFRFQVSGFGFRASDFGFRVSGLGFRVLGLGSRVSGFGFGFRVSGFGFRVSGFKFRVALL
ncbi:hypothetical protein T484DRAFT_3633814, partial [Baffinella frigidus]